MKVPILSELKSKGESPEYLFWVGCAGSFDDRSKKVTKAFVKILNKANVSYAILGKEESCTGDPAKRAGNEFLFQMKAISNIEISEYPRLKFFLNALKRFINKLFLIHESSELIGLSILILFPKNLKKFELFSSTNDHVLSSHIPVDTKVLQIIFLYC